MVPEDVSLPVPSSRIVVVVASQIISGFGMAKAAGRGFRCAFTEAVSAHPVDVSVTTRTNESLVQIGAVAFTWFALVIRFPAVLIQLYPIPGELRIPVRFTVAHPQKSGMAEVIASGFGFTFSV